MGRRLISLMAALAIGTMGALAFAAPSNAATVRTVCSLPDTDVTILTKTAAQAEIADLTPKFAPCLTVDFSDKCDGTTVVHAVNSVFNDNKFTVLTLKVNGVEKVLVGGSTPTDGTWTVGPPDNTDLQPYLVFRGTHGGTSWEFTVPFGKPHTWKLPEACPTASPSPSVSASVTPSPSSSVAVTTAAPSTTGPVAAPGGNDLPVTGASMTLSIVTLIGLLVAGVIVAAYMRVRRNRVTE